MRNLTAAIATLGPVGMLPAPGTAGSFAAIIMAAVITHQAGIGGLVVALVIVVLLAFPAIDAHYRKTGIKDAGPVVIDEVIGQWLPLLLLPPFSWERTVLSATGWHLSCSGCLISPSPGLSAKPRRCPVPQALSPMMFWPVSPPG